MPPVAGVTTLTIHTRNPTTSFNSHNRADRKPRPLPPRPQSPSLTNLNRLTQHSIPPPQHIPQPPLQPVSPTMDICPVRTRPSARPQPTALASTSNTTASTSTVTTPPPTINLKPSPPPPPPNNISAHLPVTLITLYEDTPFIAPDIKPSPALEGMRVYVDDAGNLRIEPKLQRKAKKKVVEFEEDMEPPGLASRRNIPKAESMSSGSSTVQAPTTKMSNASSMKSQSQYQSQYQSQAPLSSRLSESKSVPVDVRYHHHHHHQEEEEEEEEEDSPSRSGSSSNLLGMREYQFHAFGIPAYPTQAKFNDICRRFVFPKGWCDKGRLCYYVHPLDKRTHMLRIYEERVRARALAESGNVEEEKEEVKESEVQVKQRTKEKRKGREREKEPEQEQEKEKVKVKGKGKEEKLKASDTSVEPTPKAKATAEKKLVSKKTTAEQPVGKKPVAKQPKKEPKKKIEKVWDIELGDWVPKDGMDSGADTSISVEDQLFTSASASSPPTSVDGSDDGRSKINFNRSPNVCFEWRRGNCRYGTRCRYRHEEPNAVVRHPRPKTGPCHKWLKNSCNLEYDCRYVHGDLQYDDGPDDGEASEDNNKALQRTTRPSFVFKAPSNPNSYIYTFMLHEHIQIQCTSGFEIHNLQTAFESSTLLVSNVSPRHRPDSLADLLRSYGTVEELRIPPNLTPSSVIVVRYSDVSEAQKALKALNGKRMLESSLTVRMATNDYVKSVSRAVLKDDTVRLTWRAPSKMAYLGYEDVDRGLKAIDIINNTPVNGYYMKANRHSGLPNLGEITLCLSGVPMDADDKDFVKFAEPDTINYGRTNQEELKWTLRYIKGVLYNKGSTPLENFEVLPPPYRDGGMMRAWATFGSAKHAHDAAARLDGREPASNGGLPIRAQHVLSLTYVISPDHFSRIDQPLRVLHFQLRYSSNSIHVIRRGNGGAVIRLSAETQKDLARQKMEFEQILKGEIVRLDRKPVWDGYFSRYEGRQFLSKLGRDFPLVRIDTDPLRRRIRLYGYSTHRCDVAAIIIEKVKEFQAYRPLDIRVDGRVLGPVLRDTSFSKLQDKYGNEHVYVDFTRRAIRVQGDRNLYNSIRKIVERVTTLTSSMARVHDGPTCPVCLDIPTSPFRLPCGHEYCRSCLENYFKSAMDQRVFPLVCLGGEGHCRQKIPIGAAKELLSGGELENIINAAFLGYITRRPTEFHFCPTPDCPQVYRTTKQKMTYQCPTCLSGICTKCHSESHDGFDCAHEIQEKQLQEWIEQHNVKNCPSCGTAIERGEGCNHIECRCGTHMCWVCLQVFPDGGSLVYDHMSSVHGSFGLLPAHF